MWPYSCHRHNHEYDPPDYAPLIYRNRRIRHLKYKKRDQPPRILQKKWSNPALRFGNLWARTRKPRSKFLHKTKLASFAYQIRAKTAAYLKWHIEFLESLVSVQPMTAPTGQIFTMRAKYSNVA